MPTKRKPALPRRKARNLTGSSVRSSREVLVSHPIADASRSTRATQTVPDRCTTAQDYAAENYLAGGSKFQPVTSDSPPLQLRWIKWVLFALVAGALLFSIGLSSYKIAGLDRWDIVINNLSAKVPRGSTVASVIEATGTPTVAGKLLAIDGSVIDEAGGGSYRVQVNGVEAQPDTILSDQAVVSILPGEDIVETSTTMQLAAAYTISADNTWGAFHQVICEDPNATRIVEVGNVSGIEIDKQTAEYETEAILTRYSVYADEKVAALTFDDGPWDPYTAEILDLLAEYDAKATFFVVGTCFDGDPTMSALVKREHDEGHQVSSHTYSHAAGEGLSYDLGLMSADAQIQEVVQGQQAIATATEHTPSRMVRMPGGNYSIDTALFVLPYVSYEIGWDLDSKDWQKPGKEKIVESLLSLQPGNIILMHDGGGDRSQTVEALREALPQLAADGWKFVTVEQLLTYRTNKTSPDIYGSEDEQDTTATSNNTELPNMNNNSESSADENNYTVDLYTESPENYAIPEETPTTDALPIDTMDMSFNEEGFGYEYENNFTAEDYNTYYADSIDGIVETDIR